MPRIPDNESAGRRAATGARLPDTERLAAALAGVLQRQGAGPMVLVVDRQFNRHSMTFPSEVVTCQLDDGRRLRLFCKYSGDQDPDAYRVHWHEHRRGLRYEADVYEKVLQPIDAVRSRFYGFHQDPHTRQSWIVLDNLDGWRRAHKARRAVVQAAGWAGRFHRINEGRTPALGFLTRYDALYYLGWVRRTCQFARTRQREFPWLEALARRFPEAIELLNTRPTVVHGEYFPTNVLYRDRDISPVDWESAAVGPGAIDLAALTEGWRAEVVRECEEAYLTARWPEGTPENWGAIASAARLFHNFRWLGQREEWTVSGTTTWRFEALRTAGRALNLLP
jgi:hypothetical protein